MKENYSLYKIFNQHFKAHKAPDGVSNFHFTNLKDMASITGLSEMQLTNMVDELRPVKGLLVRVVDEGDIVPNSVYCDLYPNDDRYMVYDFVGRLDGTSDPLGFSLKEALTHITREDLYHSVLKFVESNRDLINKKPISMGNHYIRMVIPTEIPDSIDVSRAMSTGLDDSVVRSPVKRKSPAVVHIQCDREIQCVKGDKKTTHDSYEHCASYLKVDPKRIPIAINLNKPIKGFKLSYVK